MLCKALFAVGAHEEAANLVSEQVVTVAQRREHPTIDALIAYSGLSLN